MLLAGDYVGYSSLAMLKAFAWSFTFAMMALKLAVGVAAIGIFVWLAVSESGFAVLLMVVPVALGGFLGARFAIAVRKRNREDMERLRRNLTSDHRAPPPQ